MPFSFQSTTYLSSSILSVSSLNHEESFFNPFCHYFSALTAWWNFTPTKKFLSSYTRLSRVAREKSQNCSVLPLQILVSNLSQSFCTSQQFFYEHLPLLNQLHLPEQLCSHCHFPQAPLFPVSHSDSKDISSFYTENKEIILSFQHPTICTLPFKLPIFLPLTSLSSLELSIFPNTIKSLADLDYSNNIVGMSIY